MVDILLQDPMEKLTVRLGAAGGAEIEFLPKIDLPYPDPYTFRLERSRQASGPWENLGSVGSTWAVIDPNRYNWDVLAEGWYRVVLIDGEASEYPSRAVQAGNQWDRRDFIVAREICRRAYQSVRFSFSAVEGWLFRAKDWGTLCTNCGNEITNKASNSQCPICYGTGLVGRYHDAYPLAMMIPRDRTERRNSEPMGQDMLVSGPVRAIAFPRVRPKDLWAAAPSGIRYAIQNTIETVQQVRGIPLLLSFPLHRLETTDVSYGLRTPDDITDSGSSL